MIGVALGAAGLLASGIGAWKSSKANKEMEAKNAQMIQDQTARNEAWYNRNYYQDYLNSVEGQNALRKAREAWAEQNREARARQVISGGTAAQVAAVNEAGARAMGDTIANLAAQGQANKQQVDAMKMNMDNNVAQMEHGAMMTKYQNEVNNANNLMKSGMSAVSSGVTNSDAMGGWLDKLKKQ